MTEMRFHARRVWKNVKYGQAITAANPGNLVVCDMPITEMEGNT
jgi:hypothetical protein